MPVDGFLLTDKPSSYTSNDYLRVLKKKHNEKSVGHSGTLDRAATGLMLYAFGKATRLLKYFIGMDKEYEVVLKFGFKSDTFDGDGEVVAVSDDILSLKDIRSVIEKNFLGEISQVPPIYSALKISGKRSSDIIREGKTVNLKPRKIKIHSCDILNFDFPFLTLRIKCSSGTYIRSFVNDLGNALFVGAFVYSLKRTMIGPFSLNDAVDVVCTVEDFLKTLAKIDLTEAQYLGLQNGKRLSSKSIFLKEDFCFAFFEGKFVGVLEKSGGTGIKLKKEI